MELVGLKRQERGHLNLEKEKTKYRDSEEKFQKKNYSHHRPVRGTFMRSRLRKDEVTGRRKERSVQKKKDHGRKKTKIQQAKDQPYIEQQISEEPALLLCSSLNKMGVLDDPD